MGGGLLSSRESLSVNLGCDRDTGQNRGKSECSKYREILLENTEVASKEVSDCPLVAQTKLRPKPHKTSVEKP